MGVFCATSECRHWIIDSTLIGHYLLMDLVSEYERVNEVKLNIKWGERPYREREVMQPCDNLNNIPGWKPSIPLTYGLNKVNIEELTPFFSSSSLDAKIWNDHWPVIGKGLNVSALEQPIYKVEEGGRLIAESFDGNDAKAFTSSTPITFPSTIPALIISVNSFLNAS